MKTIKSVREITAQWGQYKITNELWTCPYCNEESNNVEWFVKVSMGSSICQCPLCYKFTKQDSK